eukprot:gene3867-4122_t
MRIAILGVAAVLLLALPAAMATLGDNGMTTYTGRVRAPNTLVFGNQLIVDRATEATLDMMQKVLTGTWKPTRNDPPTPKRKIDLSCLNSVAPHPLNWHMWCPGKDATIQEWVDQSGSTHRSITLRPQKNMTSSMAIWFISSYVMGLMPPYVEFQGGVYHYYHLWHPLDHVQSAWTLAPAVPGLQAGFLYTLIHERYRNPSDWKFDRSYETNGWFFVSDPVSNMLKNRFYITMPLLGLPTWNMIIEFNDTPEGLVVDVEVVAGIPPKGFDERDPTSGFLTAAGMNELLTAPLLASQKASPDWSGAIDAISRHVIEEFSNLQFFVPVLYEKYNVLGKKGINWIPSLGSWMQHNNKTAVDVPTISFYDAMSAISRLQIDKSNTTYAAAVSATVNATKTKIKTAEDITTVAVVAKSQSYVPKANTITAVAYRLNNASTPKQEVSVQSVKRAATGGNAAGFGDPWYSRAAELDHWTTAEEEQGNVRIELPVPAGQLELGKLLIKGMYFSKMDLDHLSHQQLLQLLVLADRYEVPKVVAPVAWLLAGIPAAQLQWDAVMTMYLLQLALLAGNKHCSRLFSNAAEALHHNLGDLEAVWNDVEGLKQQRMIELPFKALQQLLKNPNTSVHSENTVLYTIEQWHQHQLSQAHVSFTTRQLQWLLALTRIRHCSQQYLVTAASQGTALEKCLTSSDLAVAAALAGKGISTSQWSRMQELRHPLPTKYPAWSADQRPASAVQQGTINWKIPMSTLGRWCSSACRTQWQT